MDDRTPRYPIDVRLDDGSHWSLDDAKALACTLEWFDTDDPDEDAVVTDALGRRVSIRIDAQRILRFELEPATALRGPLFFHGPDGDTAVFRDGARATRYAESIDVENGEYGEHGWDADGRPVALVARTKQPEPGLIARLFGICVVTPCPVDLRRLDRPPEPERLRQVLLEFWAERLDPDEAAALESSSLAQLVARTARYERS